MPPPCGPFRFCNVWGNRGRDATGIRARAHLDGGVPRGRVRCGVDPMAAMGLGSAMACPPEGTWTDDSGNVLKLGGVGEPQVRVFRHRGGVRGSS